MPKPMYVWSGSAWVSVASEVESLATYATQSYADSQPGSKLIVPSSVSVGSGSGSVSTQGKVTFTSSSSVSVDGCFTSTYDTYFIDLIFTGSASNSNITMNLRNSTPADLSGTNYYRFQATTLLNTVGASQNLSNSAWTIGTIGASADRQNNRLGLTMSNLAAAEFKHGHSIGNTQDGDGDSEGYLRFFNYANAGAAAGFKISVSSGTFSGTIRIYGYKLG